MQNPTGAIELTATEQTLAEQIAFGHSQIVSLGYEGTQVNGDLAATLMESLLTRKVIPECRLRYFADPAYNISNPKASRYELFLRNSRTEEVMYRHPHFLKYLRYFVFGADLPEPIRDVFFARYQDCDGDREPLVQLARSQFRELARRRGPQDYELPDAFYQLALDSGCNQWTAASIRNAVKAVKIK